MNKVNNFISQVKNFKNKLYKKYHRKINYSINNTGKPILKSYNISAKYGKKQVLWDISIECNQGDFICLIGPNGCGKSTFLEILCAISIPYLQKITGNTLLFETDINKLSSNEKARYLSFLPQSEQYSWNYTVEEIVLMGRFANSTTSFGYSTADKKAVKNALNDVEITHLANRNFFELSGGEKQQVLIARSLAQETKIIILDEPFTSLDISRQHHMLTMLHKISKTKNITVLISLHDINQAPIYADKIALMAKGHLLSFGFSQDVYTKENLERAYNCNFSTYLHPQKKVLQVSPFITE